MTAQGVFPSGDPPPGPLAERLRPGTWDAFLGGLSRDDLIRDGLPVSLLLWGPPGSGKTTSARLLGRPYGGRFVEISAVSSGTKELRETFARSSPAAPLVLFVDELHRLNRSQQDVFLPVVEDGSIRLIGATTENPGFVVTRALLSRLRVVPLVPLEDDFLRELVARAGRELGVRFDPAATSRLVGLAGGDARRLLNGAEDAAARAGPAGVVTEEHVEKASAAVPGDRAGDLHYDRASALIKSLRGSDPDAALYWCFLMIESGDDPRFVFRRLIIFASEDVGMADPRGLELAVAGAAAFERLGMPEARIPLAHVVTYLACAPKSDRSYVAMKRAVAEVRGRPPADVPLHLRNAPTAFARGLGHGKDYARPHDFEGAVAPGVEYLPASVRGRPYYEPSDRGLEGRIRDAVASRRAGPVRGSATPAVSDGGGEENATARGPRSGGAE